MSKKNRTTTDGIVFSTQQNWEPNYEEQKQKTLLPAEQKLRVRFEHKHRGGKKVTVIDGFIGTETDLSELGKQLRQYCGVGGAAKEGYILVQGDQVAKVRDYLKSKGYTQTK